MGPWLDSGPTGSRLVEEDSTGANSGSGLGLAISEEEMKRKALDDEVHHLKIESVTRETHQMCVASPAAKIVR